MQFQDLIRLHMRRRRIGVWGDGNLGYITSLLLKKRFPDSEIYVFGVNQTKLNDFTFADKVFLTTQNLEGISIDHAFECVGGGAASKAINQIIDLIARKVRFQFLVYQKICRQLIHVWCLKKVCAFLAAAEAVARILQN